MLEFFTEGGYRKGVARFYEVCMAQSTFCEVLSQILDICEVSVISRYIIRPKKSVELQPKISAVNLEYLLLWDVLLKRTSILQCQRKTVMVLSSFLKL